MSKPKWLREIENEAGEKPVLLVEGNTDRRILAYFLEQVFATWNVHLVMLSAKGKSQVIQAISDDHPAWVGIVDQDEWDPQQINDKITNPRVKVLPRFCLENFFCVPDELWGAMPDRLKTTQPQAFPQLKKIILDSLSDWVAHGAMWRIIRNRRAGLLYDSGFPAKLDRAPVTDIDEIKAILKEWQVQLDPDQVISEYQTELTQVNHTLKPERQLREYIHGKKYYRQVIVPALNSIFQPTDADAWLERFTSSTEGLKVPPDLYNVLTEILELFEVIEVE